MKKIIKSVLKHKKPIIALSCAAIITIAVYTDPFGMTTKPEQTNYLYNANYSDSSTKILGEAALVDSGSLPENDEFERESYFVNASINKEKSRDEALETLQIVVDSSEEFPETRDKALAEILEIASYMEIETSVEEMIKAKGFEDCIAIISGDNINVIVKSDGLMTSEVAQITDIVMNETGFGAENIRIVEKV